MTISSVTAVAPGRGFTPCRRGFSNPAVTSTVSVGRQGLSLHHSRQHQREIPVRQAGQYGGGAHNVGRVGVSAVHADILFFFAVFEIATDGKST